MTSEMAAGSLAVSPLQRLVESRVFKRAIVALIVINAILLGVETMRTLDPGVLQNVFRINQMILGVFVLELVLRIAAHRASFFRDPWSIFDLVIVIAAVLAPAGPLQVLRAFRVLRVLRIVSAVPSLRRVVDGLLSAVPGIASVGVLLVIVLYIASVMSTLLFRDVAPQYFGDIAISLFTLFQTMTLEGWPDIAGAVMEDQPWAWVFFVIYILVATFMVLNLVIGIVVSAIQSRIEDDPDNQPSDIDADLLSELRALRQEMTELRSQLHSHSESKQQ